MSTVRFTLNPSLESFLKEQKSEDAKLALTQKNVYSTFPVSARLSLTLA